jgi:hypothetical protein
MTKRQTRASRDKPDDTPRYFLWVRGLSGPEPQKWTELDFGIGGWKRETVLAYRELAEEERHLPLSALASRYPPPRLDADES